MALYHIFILFQKNINEVNDIFKELAVMVHDQGEMVDSIEASVEKTEVFVERGATELRQAAQYSVSTFNKNFIQQLCLFPNILPNKKTPSDPHPPNKYPS